MTEKIDFLLEAERRGVLPESAKAFLSEAKTLLSEAKKRGLKIGSGPTSSTSFPVASPTDAASIPEPFMPKLPPQGIPGATGGFVDRSTFTATGGTIGGVAGAGVTGPLAPAGALAGMGLGAAAGSAAFDLGDALVRSLRGEPQVSIDPLEPSKRALQEGTTELLFSGGAMAAGPIIKRAGKPLLGKVLGVKNESAKNIADLGQSMGVDLGTAAVSKRGFVKGSSRVLGVFPFVSTPFRKGQARVVGQLDDAAADLLNTLAPTASKFDVAKDLTQKAGSRFKARQRITASLYKRFADVADNLSVPDVVPTSPIKDALAEIEKRTGAETIVLQGGAPLQSISDDPIGGFLRQLSDLPENITVRQARGLQRELNALSNQGRIQGFDVSRLKSVKGGLEDALNNLDVSRLPPGEGEAAVDALRKANEFFGQSARTFETPTAKRFGRVDKNMFNAKFFKPGTINADQIFEGVYLSKSPEAIQDLRRLVGPGAFRKATRKFLDSELIKARIPAKEGGMVETLFSAANFEKRLGLDTAEGLQTLSEMLKGTDVTVNDFRNFLNVAKTATDITIRDPSTFLARRVVLAGGVSAMLGGMAVMAGKVSIPVAALITYAARKGASFLMNPQQLRLMTRVMDDTLPDQQKRALLLRVLRLFGDDNQSKNAGPITLP